MVGIEVASFWNTIYYSFHGLTVCDLGSSLAFVSLPIQFLCIIHEHIYLYLS
jgi:hypothetical protein